MRFIRSISLVIARRTTARSATATTRISRICSPIASHVDQFCSTQLAAFVALSWASWSVGTAGAVEPDGDGDGDGDAPAAKRAAGRDDTAGTSQVLHGPYRRAVKVTKRSPDGQDHHTNGALCVPRADPHRRRAGETRLTRA
ncbi:hypothetical protein GCM10010206_04160 [Streptomyces cinerochromogenes]|nr:hypothetical protein GCM10010206_04160 [Streptomyces cinerochromogenes]